MQKEEWDIEKIKSIATKIRELKVCDPSCGSGSFLIQAIRIIWDYYKKFEEFIKKISRKKITNKKIIDGCGEQRVIKEIIKIHRNNTKKKLVK